jgi:hypothetical protein
MRLPCSRTGLNFCSFYLGFYLLSGIYAVGYLLFRRATPEFNPPAIAALPWTFVLVPLLNSMGISNLYGRLGGSPVLYGTLMWTALLPGAMMNGALLYLLGRAIDRRNAS